MRESRGAHGGKGGLNFLVGEESGGGGIQQKKVVLEILGAPLVLPLVGNSDTFLENNYFHKRNFMLPK